MDTKVPELTTTLAAKQCEACGSYAGCNRQYFSIEWWDGENWDGRDHEWATLAEATAEYKRLAQRMIEEGTTVPGCRISRLTVYGELMATNHRAFPNKPA